ncbi:MAG TPA: CBS domain-containing protein [Ilumatobacteraceae bacterium]|nr:CBS domain-containing protein [Ilumatobacteraceae bacterium]
MNLDITVRQPVVIECDATLADAAALMASSGVGSLIVTDHERPVGIVTDRDLVTRALAKRAGHDARVDSVMTTNLIALDADADFDDVLHTFSHHGVRRLPLVDHDRVVGIVSLDDVLVSMVTDLGGVARVLAAQIMFPHAADEPSVPATT